MYTIVGSALYLFVFVEKNYSIVCLCCSISPDQVISTIVRRLGFWIMEANVHKMINLNDKL